MYKWGQGPKHGGKTINRRSLQARLLLLRECGMESGHSSAVSSSAEQSTDLQKDFEPLTPTHASLKLEQRDNRDEYLFVLAPEHPGLLGMCYPIFEDQQC